MHLRMIFGCLVACLAFSGCGGGEEPSDVPKNPPPGKALPRFARTTSDAIRPTS